MNDRYIKGVLTVIAGALVYLCVAITPLPGISAQTASKRPGDPSGPTEVIIVGVRQLHASSPGFALPVTFNEPVEVAAAKPLNVTATEPLRVTGRVTTQQSAPDDVVVVGWKERSNVTGANDLIRAPLPVKTQ